MALAEIAQHIQRVHDVNPILAHRLARLTKGPNYLAVAGKFINEKPRPFVKWVGGKRQLLKQFKVLNLYPPADFDPEKNCYYEPFLGGGAVFFDLFPKHAVLSDTNKELVTTYNVIKSDVEKLIKSLGKHKYEKDYFYKVRAVDPATLSDIEAASRFIFLNRTAFNGMYRVNSSGGFNVPFGKYTNPRICDAENLRRVSASLRGVQIRHEDYKTVLKRAKKGDFIYFDPPYDPLSATSSFTGYTSSGFTRNDQIDLRDIYLELHKRGCFVMLSNSNSDFINKIYSEIANKKIRISKIKAMRNINSKKEGRGRIREILVTNY
jgi:DNA adenine methylase